MKATLYEALGINPTASDEDVRASLRRLIRKYYAKTRDGQGNVEEALRFINHASRILSDSERRRRYDAELARSVGIAEPTTERLVEHAIAEGGQQTDVGAATAREAEAAPADEVSLESSLDDADAEAPVDTPARVRVHHPGLTERVATLGRSPAVTIALCLLFGAFIAALIAFVTPDDAVAVAQQVLVWATLSLVGLAVVYGSVHALLHVRRRAAPEGPPLQPQTDLAILNWRREKSVFLGTNHPLEDASWIFQLRMAELERAKSGRTSEPSPWYRLAARMFDYAIWGLSLALLLSELRGMRMIPDAVGAALGHPLFAPVIITASWMPVEALLLAALGSTPGKWLFGVYLQFAISDAYARRDTQAQLRSAIRRAFRVWWEGVACGFPLLAPVLVAVAYEKLTQNQETDWDFAQDVLVTHGPPGLVRGLTGVFGLAAMLWLYGVAWHQPMSDAIEWVHARIVDALPSTELLKGGPGVKGGGIAGLGAPSLPSVGTSGSGGANAPAAGSAPGAAIDPDLDAQFAERRSRIATLRSEGPRMLRSGNYRRAAELCRTWTELDLGSADAWRCLGEALQGQGLHQEAIGAFRKAKQYDPGDRTLDAAIDRSQKGIVADFLDRYRR